MVQISIRSRCLPSAAQKTFRPNVHSPRMNAALFWDDLCLGRDSNPYRPCGPRDFKSLVSTIPPPRQKGLRRRGAAGAALCLAELLIAVAGLVLELDFDLHKTIVLGDTVGAAQGTGLDLPAVGSNCDVGDSGIFSLAGAV